MYSTSYLSHVQAQHWSLSLDPHPSSESHYANEWQCKLACGKLALPLIADFARPLGVQNPQWVSK
jgi:hypothetical protein